jgi:hypothetical protein
MRPKRPKEKSKLEHAANPFLSALNASGWTVISDYAATGEGRHVYFLRSFASSESEAQNEFRAHFFKDADDERWAWVLTGIEVHPGAFWPEFLPGFRTPPDSLEMHWKSMF